MYLTSRECNQPARMLSSVPIRDLDNWISFHRREATGRGLRTTYASKWKDLIPSLIQTSHCGDRLDFKYRQHDSTTKSTLSSYDLSRWEHWLFQLEVRRCTMFKNISETASCWSLMQTRSPTNRQRKCRIHSQKIGLVARQSLSMLPFQYWVQ